MLSWAILVVRSTILVKHPKLPITVRQFGRGAFDAGREKGISVIIDNFRASNTILALLEGGATVTPVETVEQALSFNEHIKVGEKDGKRHPLFDYDNSPAFFGANLDIIRNKNVVIRTTNGTRGIINAKGSHKIVVGAFRNLSATASYCFEFVCNKMPVSFVAMGSKQVSRIEDVYGAKMLFYKLLELLEESESFKDSENQLLIESEDNPWNSDWVIDILANRKLSDHNRADRLFALHLDSSDIIPIYDEKTNQLIPFKLS
jgi:2-phosphosulfolactate phosphatase